MTGHSPTSASAFIPSKSPPAEIQVNMPLFPLTATESSTFKATLPCSLQSNYALRVKFPVQFSGALVQEGTTIYCSVHGFHFLWKRVMQIKDFVSDIEGTEVGNSADEHHKSATIDKLAMCRFLWWT